LRIKESLELSIVLKSYATAVAQKYLEELASIYEPSAVTDNFTKMSFGGIIKYPWIPLKCSPAIRVSSSMLRQLIPSLRKSLAGTGCSAVTCTRRNGRTNHTLDVKCCTAYGAL